MQCWIVLVTKTVREPRHYLHIVNQGLQECHLGQD